MNEGHTNGTVFHTSITSAVPLLTVVLSIFTAFPKFNEFRVYLDDFFTRSLFPESIAGQILDYLNIFAEAA